MRDIFEFRFWELLIWLVNDIQKLYYSVFINKIYNDMVVYRLARYVFSAYINLNNWLIFFKQK